MGADGLAIALRCGCSINFAMMFYCLVPLINMMTVDQ